MRYTTLSQAVNMYDEANKPRGEYVLVVAGKKEEKQDITLEEAVEQAKKLVDGGMSVNTAAKEIASLTPFKKSDIYKGLL